jgi:hypothetical protein
MSTGRLRPLRRPRRLIALLSCSARWTVTQRVCPMSLTVFKALFWSTSQTLTHESRIWVVRLGRVVGNRKEMEGLCFPSLEKCQLVTPNIPPRDGTRTLSQGFLRAISEELKEGRVPWPSAGMREVPTEPSPAAGLLNPLSGYQVYLL